MIHGPFRYDGRVRAPRATPILLGASPKCDGRGVHRTVRAARTWQRIEPLLGGLGVTRVCDITGLDRVGIPVFSCVRPRADRFGITVTCGKGRRPIDAKVGAAMEAIEYLSAEFDRPRCLTAPAGDLAGRALDPDSLILPAWAREHARYPLDWVEGWELVSRSPIWVPANAVFFPYEPEASFFLFNPSTNGLAAGNTIEEAICHGLAELLERDAWSIALARADEGDCPSLDLATAPLPASELARRFESAGVEVFVRVLASEFGIPCFYAAVLEVHDEARFLAHDGMGAHPDAEVALLRALTEAAQSRAADIQGSREDLSYWRARGMKAIDRDHWSFRRAGPVRFEDLPSFPAPDVLDDIRWMMDRLVARGFDRVAVVELTRADLGIPVVRVVVPGLESFSVDRWRAGPRLGAPEPAPSGVLG
ncbi:MAG: YcaO-like family protein [Planctomycetes bacterium]|nr:YcaO-like family protein [Planctomycetota bacterium]